jgi:hypothetical protein
METETPGTVVRYVCRDCVPAWSPEPIVRMDDMRQRCASCGEVDGNPRRVVMLDRVAREGWFTATGKFCAPRW